MKSSTAAVVAPSFGPAVVTIAGMDFPVLATCLSIVALVLARWIAPPPLRKLTKKQEIALTCLLVIFLTITVAGEMPMVSNGEPLSEGMAVLWGVGLGFSGLLIIEIITGRIEAMVRAAFGDKHDGQG